MIIDDVIHRRSHEQSREQQKWIFAAWKFCVSLGQRYQHFTAEYLCCYSEGEQRLHKHVDIVRPVSSNRSGRLSATGRHSVTEFIFERCFFVGVSVSSVCYSPSILMREAINKTVEREECFPENSVSWMQGMIQ